MRRWRLGRPSKLVLQKANEKPLFMQSIENLADYPLFLEGGGQLIRDHDGEVIAAIGVTGDANEMDDICAIAGIHAVGLCADSDFFDDPGHDAGAEHPQVGAARRIRVSLPQRPRLRAGRDGAQRLKAAKRPPSRQTRALRGYRFLRGAICNKVERTRGKKGNSGPWARCSKVCRLATVRILRGALHERVAA